MRLVDPLTTARRRSGTRSAKSTHIRVHPLRLRRLDRDIHSEHRTHAQTEAFACPTNRCVQTVSISESGDRLTELGTALHE